MELKQALKILEIFEISKHRTLTCMLTTRINPNKIIAYLQKEQKKKKNGMHTEVDPYIWYFFSLLYLILSFN